MTRLDYIRVLTLIMVSTTSTTTTTTVFSSDVKIISSGIRIQLITSTSQNLSSSKTRAKRSVQLCGSRLVNAMRSICNGNYAGVSRRADPGIVDERLDDSDFQDSNPLTEVISTNYGYRDGGTSNKSSNGWNWIYSKKQYIPRSITERYRMRIHSRFRRNIIDECCKQVCTIVEMRRYCGRH